MNETKNTEPTLAVDDPATACFSPLSSQERLCARLLSHAAFVSNTQECKWSEILDKVEFFFDASVVKKASEFLRNEIGSNF
jgi:hypothetical protein